MEKKLTSRGNMGIVIVCILIVVDLLLPQLYHPVSDRARYLPRLAVTFAGVLAACVFYAKRSAGPLTFGELFLYGFKTTAVVAFLMALYTYIAVKWIYAAPSPAEMEAAVKAIELQGNALHNEAVQQAAQGAKNRWIVYVSLSIFVSLIPGIVGSLAGAVLAKKNL